MQYSNVSSRYNCVAFSMTIAVVVLILDGHHSCLSRPPPKAYEEGAENRIIDSISDVLIENPEILSAEAGDCDLPALIRSMRTTEICSERQNGKCADGKGGTATPYIPTFLRRTLLFATGHVQRIAFGDEHLQVQGLPIYDEPLNFPFKSAWDPAFLAALSCDTKRSFAGNSTNSMVSGCLMVWSLGCLHPRTQMGRLPKSNFQIARELIDDLVAFDSCLGGNGGTQQGYFSDC